MLVKIAPYVFVFLWATGFIGARLGMPYSEPGTFLSIRFASAFILIGAIALVMRAAWPGWKSAAAAVSVGFLIHGIYLGAVFWSIDQGMPASTSAVVVGLQPLLTALLAGWFLKEVISTRHWVGLFLGFLGVFLVLQPKIDVASSGVTAATIAASIIGMISVTLGTVLQKRVGANIDLRSGTALQYLGAFIPVGILSWFAETRQIEWSVEMIIAMAWAIVVLSLGAIFLLMWLIREGSVAKVSSLFFLVPGVSALIAYPLFGETLLPLQLFGMALCAVAVALASMPARKPG